MCPAYLFVSLTGVPLIFPNQSLFDEFQGITLNYVSLSAKLLKYDLSRFAINLLGRS